jgi:DNA mismatch repair protein MutL
MPIHILPPEVANQIAAGEVVERPASAIKELIENSLDAGATDIRVEIREGGRRLIRVQDDGVGIPAAEAALAFQRHATSKIDSADDLGRITTLGFRGEALASIAAVAQVSLLTRTRDEDAGTFIRMVEGREVERGGRGTPPGTLITVEHLFANVPARLKFLKQPATEASHIQQVVTRYALAYPERRFSLVSDGKLVFQSTGSGKLYDVLVKVYGLELARQMIELEAGRLETGTLEAGRLETGEPEPGGQRAGVQVAGCIGAPALHRGNRGYITLFVNRRWFQDTAVAYAVIQAYHTMLPVGRYPVGVIFVTLDLGDVDVNVHPTKAEVRFREPGAVFAAVQKTVRRTLADRAPIPSAGFGAPAFGAGAADAGWAERRAALLGAGRGGHAAETAENESQREAGPGQLAMALPLGHADAGATAGAWGDWLPASAAPDTPHASAAAGAPPGESPRPLMPILRVVGQLAATYIIAEGPDGMYLIDQHAAHERVLYEQMLAESAGHRLAVQPLLEPLLLDLSPEQAAVIAEELDTLNELGVAVEPFGGGSYLVRSIPALLSRDDPHAALTEIVDGLARQVDLVDTTREARLVTLICKRAAIKGGAPLGLPEMRELVQRLEACRSPRTCPHGRPTMVYMSAAELARQFART